MTIIDMRIPWRYVPNADAEYQQRENGTYVVRFADRGAMWAWYGEGASIEEALDDLAVNFRGNPHREPEERA